MRVLWRLVPWLYGLWRWLARQGAPRWLSEPAYQASLWADRRHARLWNERMKREDQS